jgi:GH15 family glucan-1,4-alpha-glucosidase
LQNQELLERSRAVIRSLQQEDGGITATRTDDAYPYVYPRDAVIMTMALNALGEFEASKKFYGFLGHVRRPQGEFYQRYNRGMPYVTNEHELDTTPLVLQGIYDTYKRSGDKSFLETMWGIVKECASFTNSTVNPKVGLVYTTNAIHENKELEEGFEIWTNSAAVRGLLDASRIAGALGYSELEEEWARSSKRLLARLVQKLYDEKQGIFLKVLRGSGEKIRAPDITQLAPFYFGVYHDDVTLTRTLERLKGNLWNKNVGGFRRFRDFEIVQDWHWYTGGTADAWPFFTIWAARFYRELGIREDEEACLNFLDSVVTQDFFIPERVSPLERYNEWKDNEVEFGDRLMNGIKRVESGVHRIKAPGYICWACPLGWAHAEYILLEKGEKSRDYEFLQEEITSISKRAGYYARYVNPGVVRSLAKSARGFLFSS